MRRDLFSGRGWAEIDLRGIYQLAAFLLFVLVCVETALLLTDYNVVWAHPETLIWDSMLLKERFGSASQALLQTFNYPLLEGVPRITRPISDLFQIIDVYSRWWFHKNVFPHPSISTTWVFSLLLSPIILFRASKYLDLKESASKWILLCLYLSCPGFLSLVTLYFRPGKALACFSFIVLLYLGLKACHKRQPTLGDQIFAAIVFLASLFTDEIAVFGAAILLFAFWPRIRQAILLCALLVADFAIYTTIVLYVLPVIHRAAGYPVTQAYDLQTNLLNIILLKADLNTYLQLFSTLWQNLIVDLLELSGVGILPDSGAGLLRILPIVSLICFAIVALIRLSQTRSDRNARMNQYFLPSILLLLTAIVVNNLLMNLTDHPVWGIYWYGLIVVLPWTISLAICLDELFAPNRYGVCFAFGAITSLVVSSYFLFVATNYAYKAYHYYPPGDERYYFLAPYYPTAHAKDLTDVFSNRVDRFAMLHDDKNKYELFDLTKRFVRLDRLEDGQHFPEELAYLLSETELCPQGDEYRTRQSGDGFDVFCAKYTAPSPEALVVSRQAASDSYGPDIGSLVGTYTSDLGRPYVAFEHNSGLIFVNEKGEVSAAKVIRNRVEAVRWGVSATIPDQGRAIQWSDGHIWQRVN